ncbi:PREDICTED: epidermal growth factor-like protein 7 [Merops nubicus]|uniref:epidermal growth factor-like protein 7 n=1 Tax=Merops nubicus TaxID=57421 RepID=UPI0004F00DB8|nr:PREDICTED: epidermal growth factor-like protein 7 [Merops nubicus]
MPRAACLLPGLFLILSTTSADGFARAGRRVCAGTPRSRVGAYTESHIQPVYQPYLTTCQGHRLCSTYRTLYRVAYRQAYKQLPMGSCCPGGSRANSHTPGCNTALCWVPCQNGGSCVFPGRCACPPGWTGPACQTDVDECAGQGHGCEQLCTNTAGSYRVPLPPKTTSPGHKSSHCSICKGDTAVARGFQDVAVLSFVILLARGRVWSAEQPLHLPLHLGQMGFYSLTFFWLCFSGASSGMKEEMNDLKSRVEALEQKLQLVLAPFHNLMPSAPEDVGADPISRLSHSLQQLDRIDSLSEQISFLEERLETCSCKNEL